MRVVTVLLASLLLTALLVSCAPKAAQPQTPATAENPATAPPAAAPVAPVANAPAKQAWENEWEKVVEGAKKEGRLVVYASTSEFRPSWRSAMERYGVSLEMMAGRGTQACEKILAERRASIYSGDIYTGGLPAPLITLKPKGAFDPIDPSLILPEIKDPKMWYGESLPFVDRDHTIFAFFLLIQPTFAINTNLVKPGEIKSYNDILDPKWRGKMALVDPATGGTGGKFVSCVNEIMGWDYLRKVAENKPIILNDERQRLEWLAHGKVAILLNPQAATLTGFRQIGAPVAAVIPQEGGWISSGSGSLAMLNKPPHSNAARLFVNWFFGKEGQTAAAKATGSQSARLDVPTDFLDPVLVREPGKKYFSADVEDFLLKQTEQKKMADAFNDLLKN